MFSGEIVDSSELPNTRCTYEEMGELCTEGSCSSCNIAREQKNGTVRGTILVSEQPNYQVKNQTIKLLLFDSFAKPPMYKNNFSSRYHVEQP